MLAFAHRGGARHPELSGLENTRTAFAHAVALGYRYLETDVHSTRDGVLVAFHDALLERVTDGAGSLRDLDVADLAARAGQRSRAGPDARRPRGAFPDARFNIDLKSDAAAAPLAALIHEHDLHDRVLVGSFSGRRLRRFRRARRAAGRHLRLPGRGRGVRRAPGPARPSLAPAVVPPRCRCPIAWSAGVAVTTARLVRRAHAAGLHVHVWTVDDPDEMRLLLDRGVDGLMTDRTDILRAVLRERGLWPDDGRKDA